MRILNIKSKDLKFWKSWNLLDGQKRGEIIFRRVFVLLTGALIIYLLLLAFVGKKDQNIEEVEAVETVEAVQQTEEVEEWIQGDRVTTKADGTVEVVPAETFMDKQELDKLDEDYQKAFKIEQFFKVNRNNAPLAAHAKTFVEVANKYNLDYRLLPAIATIESSGGKVLFRPYNAWGWGKRNFSSFEQGIEVVGKGLRTGYMDKGADTVEKIAPIYCPPNYKHWIASVNQFMNEIESIAVGK